MLKKAKSFLFQVLKISFSVGLIYWLVKTDKLDLRSLPLLFQWPLVLYSFLLLITGIGFISERWYRLLSSQKNIENSPITRLEIFKLTMMGLFFNFSMPGGVGGDLVKAFFFYRDHRELKVAAATSVVMDRILGLYAMIIMAFISMLTQIDLILSIGPLKFLFFAITSAFFIATGGLGLLFSRRLHKTGWVHQLLNWLPFTEKTHKLYESLHLYGASKKTLGISVLLSLCAQTTSVFFIYFLSQSLGFSLDLLSHFVVAPLGFIATALPISPAGIGVGQAAFYYLYKTLTQVDSQIGSLTITGFQVSTFLLSLIGALFYISRKDRIKNQNIEDVMS